MERGGEAAFVLSWTQTTVDGGRAAPGALAAGSVWSWQGSAIRLDGQQDVLVLGGDRGLDALRARAGRAVRRRLGTLPLAEAAPPPPPLPEDFAVTDGRAEWGATLIARSDAPPLVLFAQGLPPAGRDLWVARAAEAADLPPQAWAEAEGMICFTPGARIRVPGGDRPVEALRPGDLVLTRDSGAQPVVWTGRRRIGGGLLHALPKLRPLCLRAGGPGLPAPERPLHLSPQHLVVAGGRAARDLFNEAEVMLAAADLDGWPGVSRDHVLAEVTYLHIALPAHHVVWANGVPVETFHPARIAPGTLDAAQDAGLAAALPVLDEGAWAYGPTARRVLTRAEAAILAHGVASGGR
jgi:hypothetical protein